MRFRSCFCMRFSPCFTLDRDVVELVWPSRSTRQRFVGLPIRIRGRRAAGSPSRRSPTPPRVQPVSGWATKSLGASHRLQNANTHWLLAAGEFTCPAMAFRSVWAQTPRLGFRKYTFDAIECKEFATPWLKHCLLPRRGDRVARSSLASGVSSFHTV
jgi:hypothetical protein